MKLFDGETTLEVERKEDTLKVFLTSGQLSKNSERLIQEYATVSEEVKDGFELGLSYPIPEGSRSLTTAAAAAKSRLDKLHLAQNLRQIIKRNDKVRIPFLHPENIFVLGNEVSVMHYGITSLMAPKFSSDEIILSQYKVLLLFLFNNKISFEKIVASPELLKDKFSQKIASFDQLEKIDALIDSELTKESREIAEHKIMVSKTRHRLYAGFSIFALIAVLAMGFFTYYAYQRTIPKQTAIIKAQTSFLTQNYAQTLTDLEDYPPAQLPKSARYVLAVSSVNLSSLTLTQKEAILNQMSTKSDDNVLNYWVYTGRSDFDQALNLAQNLGDDQLTLLAYSNLYASTQLDSSMDGDKKQKLLSDYSKKIQELKEKLGI
ncbi:type VII secretion protein EssB [Lactovum odontotermitis]